MKKNIGFIGCGKMASAIISGVKNSSIGENFDIIGSEISEEVAKSASQRLGIKVLADNKELVKGKDIVFIYPVGLMHEANLLYLLRRNRIV